MMDFFIPFLTLALILLLTDEDDARSAEPRHNTREERES